MRTGAVVAAEMEGNGRRIAAATENNNSSSNPMMSFARKKHT